MFGGIAPPLNASVRLPIVVPHLEVSARMNSAIAVPLRSRGRCVAAVRVMRSGIQAIKARRKTHLASAACGNAGYSRSGHPSSFGSSGSSVLPSGVCRCLRDLADRALHLIRPTPFNVMPSAPLGLYSGAPAAYGGSIMRQPNYAFERTVKPTRNHWRQRAAAQRER